MKNIKSFHIITNIISKLSSPASFFLCLASSFSKRVNFDKVTSLFAVFLIFSLLERSAYHDLIYFMVGACAMNDSSQYIGKLEISSEVLEFRVERFNLRGDSRYLLINRINRLPSLAVSAYEISLWAGPKRRTGSIGTIIQHLGYLYSWAYQKLPGFEISIFKGDGLSLRNIKKFLAWLEGRVNRQSGECLSRSYINQILSSCKVFTVWCVSQFDAEASGETVVSLKRKIDAHEFAWDKVIFSKPISNLAPDLTDEELEVIEKYLSEQARTISRTSESFRDYVIWKIMREFGIRIGELLALRMEDLCFVGSDPHLKIIHLDERGRDYKDPRTPYAPKVKTLSRELGFIVPNTDLISLIEEYISYERLSISREDEVSGRATFLENPFVFLSHGRSSSGNALSVSAAQKIATKISNATGIKFHWHLTRHAFFNRMYALAADRGMDSISIDNIVYWGGWSSERSLKIYNRRAVRDRAKTGMSVRNKTEVLNVHK
jgi:integrase